MKKEVFKLYYDKISLLPAYCINALKRFIFNIWRYLHLLEGNTHLDSSKAKLLKPPFSKNRIFLRPTVSDMARVREFY